MPKLKCSVQTCAHNHQFLCDLDQIQVGGNQACSPSETQCDSFTERKKKAAIQMQQVGDVIAPRQPESTVRQKNVCTMKNVSVRPDESA